MLTKTIGISVLVAMISIAATTAHSATCSIAGNTYTCEATCVGTSPCNVQLAGGHAACDSVPLGGNGDGYCTICGDGSANTITGTDGNDIICGKGGDDTIYGDNNTSTGGNDIISGGDDDDTVVGRPGNDLLFGDNGNDIIQGAPGDDEIDGGAGDDTLYGDKGNDVVRGGAGDDLVFGRNSGTDDTADLGDILCGNAGFDQLSAEGSGAHCLDPGPDQTTADDCYYAPPSSPDAGDFATQRNCGSPSGSFATSTRSCNCQD